MTVLRERLPTYVDAAARLLDIDPDNEPEFTIRPKTLSRRSPFTGFPKTALPLVQVEYTGLARPPEKGNGGLLTMFFGFDLICYVASRDYEATRRLRAAWEIGIPWCMWQSQRLGGIAMAVDQTDEAPDLNIPDDAQRTLQGASSAWVATVPNCLDPLAGPAVFIPDDGSGVPGEYDPPVIPESVTIELEPMP